MNFSVAEFETSCALAGQFPQCDRPEIVFVGRSNVGKSSLINRLVSRKSLARVSAVPGKTATANFYLVDTIRFVDLPGYGYAKVSKGLRKDWSKLIGEYLAADRDTVLTILLIDMRHPMMQLDREMFHFLVDNGVPFLIAFTKADKLSATERKNVLQGFLDEMEGFEGIITVAASSLTGEGIGELQKYICEAIG